MNSAPLDTRRARLLLNLIVRSEIVQTSVHDTTLAAAAFLPLIIHNGLFFPTRCQLFMDQMVECVYGASPGHIYDEEEKNDHYIGDL